MDAAFKIHTTLGPGSLESVYVAVLAFEPSGCAGMDNCTRERFRKRGGLGPPAGAGLGPWNAAGDRGGFQFGGEPSSAREDAGTFSRRREKGRSILLGSTPLRLSGFA